MRGGGHERMGREGRAGSWVCGSGGDGRLGCARVGVGTAGASAAGARVARWRHSGWAARRVCRAAARLPGSSGGVRCGRRASVHHVGVGGSRLWAIRGGEEGCTGHTVRGRAAPRATGGSPFGWGRVRPSAKAPAGAGLWDGTPPWGCRPGRGAACAGVRRVMHEKLRGNFLSRMRALVRGEAPSGGRGRRGARTGAASPPGGARGRR